MLEFGTMSAALVGALAYGAGDFIGGRAALRLSTYGAVAIAQTVAMVLMLQHFQATGAQLPTGAFVQISLLAGVAYSMGLMLLYHGFANGRIGVVAPLCGLFSVLIPLVGELVARDQTTHWHIIGIGVCVLAIVLIAGSRSGPAGQLGFSIRLGVLSGIGYGVADLCLGVMPAEAANGSLLVTRIVAALVASALLLYSIAGRSSVGAAGQSGGAAFSLIFDLAEPKPPSGLQFGVLLAIIAGMFDMLGHIGYVTAAIGGHMGVAAAVVALFPAVSVVLAMLVLNEKVSRRQALGFAFSVIGISIVAE